MSRFLLLFFLFLPLTLQAGMNAPPGAIKKTSSTKTVEPLSQPNPLQGFGLIAIRSFQLLLSPLDGPRSPSYPTGSAYGMKAVEKEGFFLGSILTADRLFHEADQPLGPMIRLYGHDRYFDPLQANLYWWRDADL